MNQKSVIRLCLSLAVAGCVVTFMGDVLMLGGPMSGSDYFRIYKENMAHTSFERLLVGNTLGLFVILELFGFWALYLILRRYSRTVSAAIFFCFSISMLAGLAYHSCFAFYGSGLQVHQQINNEVTGLMMRRFHAYHDVFYKGMGLFYGAGSLLFIALVLWKKTVFEKWQVIVNPLALLVAVRFLLSLLPAPAGGYIAPGYGNITNSVFFCFLIFVMIRIKWDTIPAGKCD